MLTHTNRLAGESSPYLLQHAHNPVDWYPWGQEALDKAVREDKPILVSIGYSACHWCHVMERESFEQEETAEIMNRYFVNIKIDREERPDIDHLYMDAVQALSGSGGWPLNVFLTPDRRPFYGGTYFPPVRMYNRLSWREVLHQIAIAYRDRRSEIEEQAQELLNHLKQSGRILAGTMPATESSVFSRSQADLAFTKIMEVADRVEGGFGQAPKFPQSFSIRFLLRYAHCFDEPKALEQACLSIDKMLQGGLFDQVGGGFARYATDSEWLVPHFEKMTYDNALLALTLADAYMLTGKESYLRGLQQTLAFVQRELMGPEGGFFSALDADSEGIEGRFYTWSRTELNTVLGTDAEKYASLFDITEGGNWEHTNIPRLKKPLVQIAAGSGIPVSELYAFADACNGKLLEARGERVRPATDDKTLLGWNALMNRAYTQAYAATGDPFYLSVAEENMTFLFREMRGNSNAGWYHSWKLGQARIPAFLDDYASLADALIQLNEVTGNHNWLREAMEITEAVISHFSDEEGRFFYYTPEGQTDVLVRKKDIYDGALPSGNAVMAYNLYRLSHLFDKPEWRNRAIQMTDQMSAYLVRYPNSFGYWALLHLEISRGTDEIVVLGKNAVDTSKEILRTFYPHRVLQYAETPDPTIPLMEGKEVVKDLTIYLCRDFSCRKPVHSVQELMQIVDVERKT